MYMNTVFNSRYKWIIYKIHPNIDSLVNLAVFHFTGYKTYLRYCVHPGPICLNMLKATVQTKGEAVRRSRKYLQYRLCLFGHGVNADRTEAETHIQYT